MYMRGLRSQIRAPRCSRPCQATGAQLHSPPHIRGWWDDHIASAANTLPRDGWCDSRTRTQGDSGRGSGSPRPGGCAPRAGSRSRACRRSGRTRTRPHRADGTLRHHSCLKAWHVTRDNTMTQLQILPRSGSGVPYMQLHLWPGLITPWHSRHSWSVVRSQL